MAHSDPRPSAISARSTIGQALLAGLLALLFFLPGLGDQPFVDEYAYITQSYQPDLLFEGRTDDPAWLDFLTYDLVPLPKYMINGAYRLAGIGRPRPLDAAAWYRNTHYHWGSTRELVVARLPSVIMAAIGCAAIFAIGSMMGGPLAGWFAAGLLAINPLYRLHAHRAMSEAPCEALSLVALALALWTWQQAWVGRRGVSTALLGLPAAGLVAGLAILAKFNGILVLVVLAAWSLWTLATATLSTRRKAGLAVGTWLAAVAALAVFILLNLFMTAHPRGPLPPGLAEQAELGTVGRLRFLLKHRFEVSRGQQQSFPHNALRSPIDRIGVLAVQGFGRFGPLGPPHSDSERRYDLAQDWGALLWLPLVLFGLYCLGNDLSLLLISPRETPLEALLGIWACVAAGVVAAYLPMAWDRYQLPIQAPASLLGGLVLAAGVRRARRRSSSRSRA